ncbi:MAG: hypothetical protein ACMUJM_18725 [bacterium]
MFLDRRVHMLKLRAGCEEDIRHGAIIMEDALRTASLPGLPKNGLLLIKRLSLGKFSARLNSAMLARHIDSHILALRPQIINAEKPDQPEANEVWFEDEIQPFVILASLLAHDVQPRAWYWRRAVAGWSPQMSKEKALKHIVYMASKTELRAAAAAIIVDRMINEANAYLFLHILQPQDGQALLNISGLSQPQYYFVKYREKAELKDTPSLYKCLALPWKDTLRFWITHWGKDDSRSVWLANCALILLNATGTTSSVARVIAEASTPKKSRVEALPQRIEEETATQEVAIGIKDEQMKLAETQKSHKERIPQAALGIETVSSDEALIPEGGASVTWQQLEESITFHPGALVIDQSPFLATETHGAARVINGGYKDVKKEFPKSRNGIDKEYANEARYKDVKAELPKSENCLDKQYALEVGYKNIKEKFHKSPNYLDKQYADTLAWDIQGTPSDYAGFPFLISILEWLGIRDILTRHPHLADQNLPAAILWGCVDMLGINHDDPICQFLPKLLPISTDQPLPFVAPSAWLKFCLPATEKFSPLAIQRVRGKPGLRLFYEASGQILLACVIKTIPARIRSLAQDHPLKILPIAEPMTDMDLIIDGFLQAIEHFLDYYVHIDLHDLITRPGRIATTRTHLDVTFNLDQVDLSIRKAGLDIDPGWVDWLGRIILFHYVSESEEPYK